MLSTFPHLITEEFEQACTDLRRRYSRHSDKQGDWLSVETVQCADTTGLRITKELITNRGAVEAHADEPEPEQDGIEDNDEEALQVVREPQAVIHYDILLSPVYRVPVLYFSISDPHHRYPPTMATLYEHLIPTQFKAQTESGGVIGGISVQVSIPLGRNMQLALSEAGSPHFESPSLLHPPVPNSRGNGG
jgi:ubiquitin-like-conjugating enzyme ATG10